MKFALPIAAVLGLAAPTAEAQESAGAKSTVVYTVKQQGGGMGIMVDEIAVIQKVTVKGREFWVVERRRHDQRLREKTFSHQWIDGRACAPLAGVIAGVAKLPPVQFAEPDAPQGWVSDMPYVTLTGPVAGGKTGEFLTRRDLFGPLSKWWWGSEKALASCWADSVFLGDNQGSLPVRLGTDEDAAQAGRPPS